MSRAPCAEAPSTFDPILRFVGQVEDLHLQVSARPAWRTKKSATRWNRAKSTPKEEGGGDKRSRPGKPTAIQLRWADYDSSDAVGQAFFVRCAMISAETRSIPVAVPKTPVVSIVY